MTNLESPWAELLTEIGQADSAESIEAIRLKIFGRKAGMLTEAMKDLGSLSVEEKREKGQFFNQVKTTLESALSDRLDSLRSAHVSKQAGEGLDLTIDLPEQDRGHLHPIHEFIRAVEDVFGRMGFDTAEGPEIETEDNNFNKLNIPETHAARDSQDTFWIKSETVLRTHTSPVQIRYMQEHKPPFRMICPGKVYRKDSDATHSPMFHQFEGIMVGKDVSLANMKHVMEAAVKELVSDDVEFRWRTGYFPFVEPGLEMDMRWRGDESQSREGKWLEVCGCGMVHPNVLKNVGIDPDEWQGFAFGFGVERLLMIKHQIPDLRQFYASDLRFLKQF